MPPTLDRAHSPPGQEHHPPNIILNIKGETLVDLYDDAYYFWHPGTNTFLTNYVQDGCVVGAPTAQYWDVRQVQNRGQVKYYSLWCQELHGKRKCALDLFLGDLSPGTRIITHVKHDGHNQKWVLRSDGDVDG